jgi:hypothetical protein
VGQEIEPEGAALCSFIGLLGEEVPPSRTMAPRLGRGSAPAAIT